VLDRNKLGKKVGDMRRAESRRLFMSPTNGVGLPVTGQYRFPTRRGRPQPEQDFITCTASPAFWNGSKRPDDLHLGRKNESLRAWTINLQTGTVAFVGQGGQKWHLRRFRFKPHRPGGYARRDASRLLERGRSPDTGIVWALAPVDGDAKSWLSSKEIGESVWMRRVLDTVAIDQQTP